MATRGGEKGRWAGRPGRRGRGSVAPPPRRRRIRGPGSSPVGSRYPPRRGGTEVSGPSGDQLEAEAPSGDRYGQGPSVGGGADVKGYRQAMAACRRPEGGDPAQVPDEVSPPYRSRPLQLDSVRTSTARTELRRIFLTMGREGEPDGRAAGGDPWRGRWKRSTGQLTPPGPPVLQAVAWRNDQEMAAGPGRGDEDDGEPAGPGEETLRLMRMVQRAGLTPVVLWWDACRDWPPAERPDALEPGTAPSLAGRPESLDEEWRGLVPRPVSWRREHREQKVGGRAHIRVGRLLEQYPDGPSLQEVLPGCFVRGTMQIPGGRCRRVEEGGEGGRGPRCPCRAWTRLEASRENRRSPPTWTRDTLSTMTDLLQEIRAGEVASVYYLCGERYPMDQVMARGARGHAGPGGGEHVQLRRPRRGETKADGSSPRRGPSPCWGGVRFGAGARTRTCSAPRI